MSDFSVQADYVNLQYQVQKDGKYVDIKLPAKLQAAMIQQVVNDTDNAFRLVLQSRMSDVPPGLVALLQ